MAEDAVDKLPPSRDLRGKPNPKQSRKRPKECVCVSSSYLITHLYEEKSHKKIITNMILKFIWFSHYFFGAAQQFAFTW